MYSNGVRSKIFVCALYPKKKKSSNIIIKKLKEEIEKMLANMHKRRETDTLKWFLNENIQFTLLASYNNNVKSEWI